MSDFTASVLCFALYNLLGNALIVRLGGWVAEPSWTWWQREKNYQTVMLFKLRHVPISF